jgi:hypothetical protein
MTMLRSIFAVLAGDIIWTILWLGTNAALAAAMPGAFQADGSIDSSGLLAVILVLSVLISIIAGYSTARLASAHEVSHALALGVVLLLIGVFVQSQYWEVLPLWYHLTFLALLIPAAWLGGKLRLGQKTGTGFGIKAF